MRKRNIKHFLAKPRGRLDSTDTNLTFSMSRGTAARLKEIATVENTSLQEIVAVAIDEWLARRPEASDIKASQPACSWSRPSKSSYVFKNRRDRRYG
jgi:hypothetical protein